MNRKLHATLCGLLVLAGCGPSKPVCTPEMLAKIEAAFVNETLEACRGFNYDTCPALPALREKYQAKRDAWTRCEP